LVVIGIIAVLVSILLPALNAARESAESTKCLTNLRQCGLALSMYVNDNKGWFPYVARDNSWKPYAATLFGTGLPGAVGTQVGDAQRSNFHRALMRYLGGTFKRPSDEVYSLKTSLFRCPAALDYGFPSQAPLPYAETNYFGNGVFINRKMTQIHRSSQVISMSEGRYVWNVSAMRPYPNANVLASTSLEGMKYKEWLWVETGALTAGPNRLLSFTVHRHAARGNVVYVDGHGANADYRDIRPTDFGLADGDPADGGNQGMAADTHADLSANSGLKYYADLR